MGIDWKVITMRKVKKHTFILPQNALRRIWDRLRGITAPSLLPAPTRNGNGANGETFTFNGITYNVPGVKYHGRRDDGTFVPILYVGRQDPRRLPTQILQCLQEQEQLRANGHTVENLWMGSDVSRIREVYKDVPLDQLEQMIAGAKVKTIQRQQ